MRRVDHSQEHICGQIRRVVRISYAAGDEPLDRIDVRAVERLEELGIFRDRRHVDRTHPLWHRLPF
jgi:hypothetical protein